MSVPGITDFAAVVNDRASINGSESSRQNLGPGGPGIEVTTFSTPISAWPGTLPYRSSTSTVSKFAQ